MYMFDVLWKYIRSIELITCIVYAHPFPNFSRNNNPNLTLIGSMYTTVYIFLRLSVTSQKIDVLNSIFFHQFPHECSQIWFIMKIKIQK